MKDINVLYIDDEISNLNAFKASFRRSYNVFTAISSEDGLDILSNNDIHVIITDQRMPNVTGTQFLKKSMKINPDAIRILITAYSDINTVIDAINNCSIYKYLTKPWDTNILKKTINDAYDVILLKKENNILIDALSKANDALEKYLSNR